MSNTSRFMNEKRGFIPLILIPIALILLLIGIFILPLWLKWLFGGLVPFLIVLTGIGLMAASIYAYMQGIGDETFNIILLAIGLILLVGTMAGGFGTKGFDLQLVQP